MDAFESFAEIGAGKYDAVEGVMKWEFNQKFFAQSIHNAKPLPVLLNRRSWSPNDGVSYEIVLRRLPRKTSTKTKTESGQNIQEAEYSYSRPNQ